MPPRTARPDLDASELLTLELTLRGDSLKQIAFELGVSNALASRIRKSALGKVGLPNVCQFIAACAAGTVAGFDKPTLQKPVPINPMTPAESEVARHVVLGRSNRAIARHRGTAERTVANQLQGLFRKLSVQSRVELAVALARLGTE